MRMQRSGAVIFCEICGATSVHRKCGPSDPLRLSGTCQPIEYLQQVDINLLSSYVHIYEFSAMSSRWGVRVNGSVKSRSFILNYTELACCCSLQVRFAALTRLQQNKYWLV